MVIQLSQSQLMLRVEKRSVKGRNLSETDISVNNNKSR